MQTFTFFMVEDPRHEPGFIFDAFTDRDAAVAFGRSLLTPRSGYRAVQVITGDEQIAWLEPAGPPRGTMGTA